MMYLGIDGRFDLAHHNIHIAANYARNLDEIENQHILSSDPSFYVQNACVTDPTLAPGGMSTLYVLVPVTHQHPNVAWPCERDRFRSLMLKQLAKAGFKDVEMRIRYERVITPADWDQKFEINKGAFSKARALAARIKSGFVLINDIIVPTADPRMPFGGAKASGFGVTRGDEGLLEMTFPHVVAVRAGNWHPHLDDSGISAVQLFSSYIDATHGKGARRIAAFGNLVKALIDRTRNGNRGK